MADGGWSRERYGEAFWRAHHEAWRQGDLNQREYCEAHGLSLKAFGNWRAKFKAEPQPPVRKLLYRRELSRRLSHTLSHRLSHMTNGSPEPTLTVPPARDGHRRSFSDADKRRIVEEAGQSGASLSEVARRYGIAARVLFRWKQEFKPSDAPPFVTVQIAEARAPSDATLSHEERALIRCTNWCAVWLHKWRTIGQNSPKRRPRSRDSSSSSGDSNVPSSEGARNASMTTSLLSDWKTSTLILPACKHAIRQHRRTMSVRRLRHAGRDFPSICRAKI
jgi:transposase-like protein